MRSATAVRLSKRTPRLPADRRSRWSAVLWWDLPEPGHGTSSHLGCIPVSFHLKVKRSAFPLVRGGVVGLPGLGPGTSSLSAIQGQAPCPPAFPQVDRERKPTSYEALSAPSPALQSAGPGPPKDPPRPCSCPCQGAFEQRSQPAATARGRIGVNGHTHAEEFRAQSARSMVTARTLVDQAEVQSALVATQRSARSSILVVPSRLHAGCGPGGLDNQAPRGCHLCPDDRALPVARP